MGIVVGRSKSVLFAGAVLVALGLVACAQEPTPTQVPPTPTATPIPTPSPTPQPTPTSTLTPTATPIPTPIPTPPPATPITASVIEDWVATMNAGNLDAVADLFADDAVFTLQFGPEADVFTGKEEIRAELQNPAEDKVRFELVGSPQVEEDKVT